MKEISKMSWEDPKMLELDALPEAFGNCVNGETASGGGSPSLACTVGGVATPGDQSCHTGGQTSAAGPGHLCISGGIAGPLAGDCQTGSTPGP
jgi:hypothetical protein